MRLEQRNGKVEGKVAGERLNQYFFFDSGWVAILDEDTVSDLRCDTFDLPENRLVSPDDLLGQSGRR